MNIGVYGSAASSAPPVVNQKARAIGRRIAEKGHWVLTGGSPGVPYQAVLGAQDVGGRCVAFSPATSLNEHKNKYHFPTAGFSDYAFLSEELAFLHKDNPAICKKYRNVALVAASDAGIVISGRVGTMNEFTILYDAGKNIGILEGSGGITERAIKTLVEDSGKESKTKLIWDKNPVSLVDRLIDSVTHR